MKSIEELEKYLEDECYSFVEINIGKHHAHEGIVIEKNGDAYEFGYSERGNKRILMSFSSEQELVEYALEKLQADKWNKAHLVAWVWSEAEIQQAEAELKNYNISFERNDVPNYLQGKNAYRIFKRDRFNHASPNSAQTESVCAGALRVQLAGDAVYFGKLVKKKYIGDGLREIEYEDIKRANRLMYITAFLCELLSVAVMSLVLILL